MRGVNLYAKQRVDGSDRRQLERLCRYITRPPIAQERLERRADGRFELAFKSVWKDGTRALVLEGEALIARLVAAIPPPRFHLVRYFGVLSSRAAGADAAERWVPDGRAASGRGPLPRCRGVLKVRFSLAPEFRNGRGDG